MIIHISEKLRIHGTETCYQLKKKQKRNGADDWKPFKYYAKLADAIGAACEREIRTHPANTLTDAIEAAHAIATKYGNLLDGALSLIRLSIVQKWSARVTPSFFILRE